MRLKAVILEHFRGYNERARIDLDQDLTAFIGKNDTGKSTILEALEIFFNNTVVKIDSKDRCVYTDDPTITIGCVFDPPVDEIVIDETSRTTLAQEHLLNEAGELEIYKKYNGESSSPKPSIYVHAFHPGSDGLNDLLEQKITELKKRIKARGIPDENITDQRSNVALRQALWASEQDLQCAMTELPVSKAEAKAIWEKLGHYLPTYALFKSDRGSSDEDTEVQDPMKLAVAQALAEVDDQLTAIKEEVKRMATDTANRTLDKLREMDSTLADELTPGFKEEPKWEKLFKLSLAG